MTIPAGQSENVPAFVLQAEKIIDIQAMGFLSSRFALTNRSYVIWIDPSNFWRECEMKRSFFFCIGESGRGILPRG